MVVGQCRKMFFYACYLHEYLDLETNLWMPDSTYLGLKHTSSSASIRLVTPSIRKVIIIIAVYICDLIMNGIIDPRPKKLYYM